MISVGTFGFVNAFGAFADFYNEQYLTLAGTAGAIFDCIGPRYLIPLSGVITVFSLFMLSITKPEKIYQQFLSQSVLFGLGATMSFFPSMSIMAHWFKNKLPYAVGCFVSGASLGGVIFPIMIAKLIPKIGFGWTIRVFAFITLAPMLCLSCLGCWFTFFAVFNPFFYLGLSAQISNPNSGVNGYYLVILVPLRLIATRVGRYIQHVMVSTAISTILVFALWYTSFEQANLIVFAALHALRKFSIDRMGKDRGTYAFMASATLQGIMSLIGVVLICISRFIRNRKLFVVAYGP
ncbi:hypothetical protein BDP27DRAFT_1334533 [Rhodocollybia butyracea]|uniref:Monocarboxylate transporter n=1 Tax=Rhodocollybia butyracea TaxID=206335 RepID=A0A9P5PIJ3_9AGAR|nr:hypothetical protein BDP27DRAFT_1334533 [Rhodocollybia butyracea]